MLPLPKNPLPCENIDNEKGIYVKYSLLRTDSLKIDQKATYR